MTGHNLSAGPAALTADRLDAQRKLDAAAGAAAQLLTDTVNAVTPGTSPRTLLTHLQRYRAHLSALVTAYLAVETDQRGLAIMADAMTQLKLRPAAHARLGAAAQPDPIALPLQISANYSASAARATNRPGRTAGKYDEALQHEPAPGQMPLQYAWASRTKDGTARLWMTCHRTW